MFDLIRGKHASYMTKPLRGVFRLHGSAFLICRSRVRIKKPRGRRRDKGLYYYPGFHEPGTGLFLGVNARVWSALRAVSFQVLAEPQRPC